VSCALVEELRSSAPVDELSCALVSCALVEELRSSAPVDEMSCALVSCALVEELRPGELPPAGGAEKHHIRQTSHTQQAYPLVSKLVGYWVWIR